MTRQVAAAPGTIRRVKEADRFGRWIALGPLGSGGVGEVWLCEDDAGTRGALKVLRPDIDPEELVRFEREARSLDALRHGTIVRMLDSGTAKNGAPYLVMEFVEGENLEHRLRTAGALDEATCVAWFADLADGLAHAHANGIHHRDIKASNVLVRAGNRPVLVDFGASLREGDDRVTNVGLVLGTVRYLPPEVLSGEEREPARADVYALGQLLYEALTGELAFQGKGSKGHEMWTNVLSQKLRSKALDPGPMFGGALRDAVRAATAPLPEERIATMEELADRLDEVRGALTGLPVLRRGEEAPTERVTSAPKRDVVATTRGPALLVIGGVAVLAFGFTLVVTLAMMWWWWSGP